MPDTPARDRLKLAFIVSLVVVILMGLVLMYLGVGTGLGTERTVIVKVRAIDIANEAAKQVKAGEALYTEPAGMRIGTITDVKVRQRQIAVADATGTLEAADDPTMSQVDLTIEAKGRLAGGVVVLGNQVVSVSQRFQVYTDRSFFDAVVVNVDVR